LDYLLETNIAKNGMSLFPGVFIKGLKIKTKKTSSRNVKNVFGQNVEIKMTEPIHVTDAEFENTVLRSKLPVVVDFWAPWCGPCRMVAPILDKIAAEQAGKLVVAKVNTDENGEWAMKYGVQGIPTMLFIANGKVMHKQVGAMPEGMLRQVLDVFMGAVTAAAN
jgi:thioredoxin 1